MPETETLFDYFMHYLAPTIVSGFVAIFCFWLGVHREKRKEGKKEKNEIVKRKESVILSLWEIGIYAEQNKDVILSRVEKKNNQTNIVKSYLWQIPLDFYEIAKNYNFFDFNYELKSDFILLKVNITAVNSVISMYNNVFGKWEEGMLETLKHQEEQIIKTCDVIYTIYKRIIISKYLVIPMLKHLEKLEEMKKKVKYLDEYAKE